MSSLLQTNPPEYARDLSQDDLVLLHKEALLRRLAGVTLTGEEWEELPVEDRVALAIAGAKVALASVVPEIRTEILDFVTGGSLTRKAVMAAGLRAMKEAPRGSP